VSIAVIALAAPSRRAAAIERSGAAADIEDRPRPAPAHEVDQRAEHRLVGGCASAILEASRRHRDTAAQRVNGNVWTNPGHRRHPCDGARKNGSRISAGPNLRCAEMRVARLRATHGWDVGLLAPRKPVISRHDPSVRSATTSASRA